MIASSVPNMNLARHLESQVLPTPLTGRGTGSNPSDALGSLRPERVRRTARLIELRSHASWLMTSTASARPPSLRRRSSFGLVHPVERDAGHLADRLGDDVLIDLAAGLDRRLALPPLLLDALPSSSEVGRPGRADPPHARSPGWRPPLPSPSLRRSISWSISRMSGGWVIERIRIRAPASSITSIALSGRKRPLM